MPFAILQTQLDIPEVERLKRAFRRVPFLTDVDAHTLAQDAFGILVKNLDERQAVLVHGALLREGVETEIVDERYLPKLPPAKLVHRLGWPDAGLRVYDALGRAFNVPWMHVGMIAAGAVTAPHFKRIERRVPTVRYTMGGHPYQTYEVQSTTREVRECQMLGEIFIGPGAMRYTFRADRFNFNDLGAEKTNSLTENFCRVIRNIAGRASNAALNRGAYFITQNPGSIFAYPSKNAFYEEVIWLLWRWRQRDAHADQEGHGTG